MANPGPTADEIDLGDVTPVVGREDGETTGTETSFNRFQRMKKEWKAVPCKFECTKTTIAYFAFVTLFVVGALVLGLTLHLSGLLPLKNYNLKVIENGTLHLENIQIRGQIASIYTPKHEEISETDTWHDFEHGWSCIMDITNNVCFAKPLNKSAFPSVQLFQSVLDELKGSVLHTYPSKNYDWLARPLSYSQRLNISQTIVNQCIGKGMPVLSIERNIQSKGCNSACVSQYTLKKEDTKTSKYTFDMASVDCIKYNINCDQVKR